MAPATLRRESQGLVQLASNDLASLWELVSQGAAADVALHDLLPAIVLTYGEAGAALAADWYDDQREKTGIPGRFPATPAPASDRGTHALIGWALIEASDDAALHSLILGGVQRRITDHVRETVTRNAVSDPGAIGWQRVARADGCGFCALLAGRGAVYGTEETATFASHDDCYCSAAVAWKNEPVPVRPYTPSSRNITDADRARVREWIATH